MTNNGSAITKKENKPKTIIDLVQSSKNQFANALPKHINTDRFVRIAITTIRLNPKLAKCSQESLLGALMVSAQLGLTPLTARKNWCGLFFHRISTPTRNIPHCFSVKEALKVLLASSGATVGTSKSWPPMVM